jgi:glycosyltransferase involved in cell wall biosynthesis
MTKISLVIPARDEEQCIEAVVRGFVNAQDPRGTPWLDEVVVGDNGSLDATAARARAAGATVVHEPRPGYGSACLAALAYLRTRPQGPPAVVVFADGDGSNDPQDLGVLLEPLLKGYADFVIGARSRPEDRSAMSFPQRFGNRLACTLMRPVAHVAYQDLGPYRAIRWSALERLGMCDPNYGWTVEMQLKAVKAGLRVREVLVRNHARIGGQSKVSGTVKGVVGAGYKIIFTILRYR